MRPPLERWPLSSVCLAIGLDDAFARQLRPWLGAQQLRPYFVDGAAASATLLEQWRFDVIVIDGEGQRDSGRLVELASRRGRSIVVLFVADADEEKQFEGLARGATEVIAKPASARLVAAKIRSLLDAPQAGEEGPRGELRFGPLSLSRRRATARLGGQLLPLTMSEFNILFLLVSNPEDFVSREAIGEVLAPRSGGKQRRSADMHVLRIRRKLDEAEASNVSIETGYGRGYRLTMTAPAAAPGCRAVSADVAASRHLEVAPLHPAAHAGAAAEA